MPATARSRRKGTSKHDPTEDNRTTVRDMAHVGIDQNAICAFLDITVPTLHKHYRRELDTSYTTLQFNSRAKLVEKAEAGDSLCLIYLNKVLGWYDRPPAEGTPPPSPFPPVTTTSPVEAARRIAFALMAGMTEPKIIDVEESA